MNYPNQKFRSFASKKHGTMVKEKSEKLMQTVIDTVVLKGKYGDIKVSNLEGYESPPALTGKTSGVVFVPDIIATKNGKRTYFEIAMKHEDHNSIINKWKLIQLIAKMKGCDFAIVIPKGQFRFANDLMKNYDIDAKVIRI